MSYRIDVAGGHGPFTADMIDGNPAARAWGFVHIHPSEPSGCATTALDSFEVLGEFTAVY